MHQQFFEMTTYKSIKLGQALLALVVSVVAWPSASAEENPLDRYVAKPDPAYEYSCLLYTSPSPRDY